MSVRRRLLSPALLTLLAAAPAFALSPAQVENLLRIRDAQALTQAQALVDANEGSAHAWRLLARAQLQKGLADEAVDSAEQAVELAPNDAQAQLWLGNSLGVRIGQVNMLRKMAMAPDLRDAFEAAVRLDPNLLGAREALIQFYVQAPEAMGGGVAKAKAQVAEIAKRNPVRGHLAQATIERFGDDDAAVARSVDAAVAAAPGLPADDVDSRVSVAANLVALKRHAQAREFLLAWGAEQPRQAAPHYQLGRLAAVTGENLDEGRAALKRYLESDLVRAENDPRDTHAWWRLGQIEAHAEAIEAARAAFQTALRIDPANAEARKSLQAL